MSGRNSSLALDAEDADHVAVFYETCLLCKEQQDTCEKTGQVYDPTVCHCVFPASRTFLNSFYTLGVVMLTVMVCCFLVFGVQKGDENVLNTTRRSTRRNQSSPKGQRRHSSGLHTNHNGSAHRSSKRNRYGSARTVGSLGFGVEGGVGPTTLIVSTPTNNMINSPGPPEVPANGAAAAFAPPKKIQLNDNQDVQRPLLAASPASSLSSSKRVAAAVTIEPRCGGSTNSNDRRDSTQAADHKHNVTKSPNNSIVANNAIASNGSPSGLNNHRRDEGFLINSLGGGGKLKASAEVTTKAAAENGGNNSSPRANSFRSCNASPSQAAIATSAGGNSLPLLRKNSDQ